MLDIAWPELVVIGAVALVAIGPKDLPKVMHTLGRWIGKVRGMANDIQRSLEQLSYESEVAEKLKKDEAAMAPQSRSQPSAPLSPAPSSLPTSPPAPPQATETDHDIDGAP